MLDDIIPLIWMLGKKASIGLYSINRGHFYRSDTIYLFPLIGLITSQIIACVSLYVISVLLASTCKARKIRYDKPEVKFSFTEGVSNQVKQEFKRSLFTASVGYSNNSLGRSS